MQRNYWISWEPANMKETHLMGHNSSDCLDVWTGEWHNFFKEKIALDQISFSLFLTSRIKRNLHLNGTQVKIPLKKDELKWNEMREYWYHVWRRSGMSHIRYTGAHYTNTFISYHIRWNDQKMESSCSLRNPTDMKCLNISQHFPKNIISLFSGKKSSFQRKKEEKKSCEHFLTGNQ